MKRTMIIVWRKEIRLQSEKKIEGEDYVYITLDVEEGPENKLIYIGRKGDKGNPKEKISELIRDELTKDGTSYYLLLLHGGKEICYDEDDIKNIIQEKDNIEGYLFRGGAIAKEPIYYHSQNNFSGLIEADSSKIFLSALNEKDEIKKESFNHVWNYYTKKKLDDLYHIFSIEAITCLGILECIEKNNYENAKKYISQAWKENTFENILEEINSKKEVVGRVREIDIDVIDKDSIGYLMAEELKKEVNSLKPQDYENLAIDNIEKDDFPLLLKNYLKWFGNFSDVLKKYR